MRRQILYTLGRPAEELEAIRKLIAEARAIDTKGQPLFDITAKHQHGRVYYAVVNPDTETGLIFFISPGSRIERDELMSEWEIQDLFKLARKLSYHKFRMLSPLRIYEDEIQAVLNRGTFFNASNL